MALANILLAALLIGLTPFIFGVRYLDAVSSAAVLEQFVSLCGIILFTPLFAPEQDPSVREIADSKSASPAAAPAIRLAVQSLALAVLTGAFILLMKSGGCTFPAMRYWFGTFATAFVLGGLGAFLACVTDNPVIGYMGSAAYYLLSLFNGEKLGALRLSSLGGGSLKEKYALFFLALILFGSAVFYRCATRRLR